ncbi:hypothetical protein MBLNU230_g2688t1 [Neophaeotheca triangularis]
MDSIRPYINWQTTIQYVKEPPQEYAENVQAPFDFEADYERIYNAAKSDSYANEYEFGFDLYRSFQKTHDGHFVFLPDSVGGIFTFGRTVPLVSVSSDGSSIPEVYAYDDVLGSSFGNISFTPSPLSMIDGEDSTEWLLSYSQYGSLQDPDALWNNMFYLLAQVQLGPAGTGAGTFVGGGRGRWVYPGPTTTLTFANGTEVVIDNFARVLAPFDNITTGADIYREYFIPPVEEQQDAEEIATSTMSSSTMASTTSSMTSSTSIPAPGYPTPLVRQMNNLNSGYFLEGEDYDDVAVLAVPNFVGSAEDSVPFQAVNTYLINQAVAQNKSKLIIDVSANGGGTILQGYDLFRQLFPQILPDGYTRFRAHEALDLIGQEVSWFAGQFPREAALENDTLAGTISTAFNYRTDVDIDYENFESWDDKFGPFEYGPRPEDYTSIIRWNISDVLTPLNSGGIVISGTANRTNITESPFKPENIVIVADGYCASTCTIFSELMRQQAGIRTLALGGRPSRSPIQAVGGVKGTNNYPFSYILQAASLPFEIAHYHDAAYYNTTALADYTDLPLWRAASTPNTNVRDGIRKGDDDQVPLQFYYEPADCRLFYTPEMAVDQSAAWRTVADAAFRGVEGLCVGGDGDGQGVERREVVKKQGVRRGLDGKQHVEAMSNVWTGKDGVTVDGDGFMFL